MGRPEYDDGAISARENLSAAYWSLLECTPFHGITPELLCLHANVPRSAFFELFADVEDMAYRLFNDEVMAELPQLLLYHAMNPTMTNVSDIDMSKAFLYARSESTVLTSILRESLQQMWLKAMCLDTESLTLEQRIDCTIIFGGLVACMGDTSAELDQDAFYEIASRTLGKGMLRTLAAIADKKVRLN